MVNTSMESRRVGGRAGGESILTLLCSFWSLIFARIDIKIWNFWDYKVYNAASFKSVSSVRRKDRKTQIEKIFLKMISLTVNKNFLGGQKNFIKKFFSQKIHQRKNSKLVSKVKKFSKPFCSQKIRLVTFWHPKSLPDFPRYPEKRRWKIN